jgi:hypothetical protein
MNAEDMKPKADTTKDETVNIVYHKGQRIELRRGQWLDDTRDPDLSGLREYMDALGVPCICWPNDRGSGRWR